MSESSGRAGAPWALRGLVVASVLLPLLVFAGGGWLAWRGTVREANASLQSALAVSDEQATRVFDTHVLLGGRVNDLLGDLDDDAVIARERELHDRLAAMIAGYSQVTAIVVTGADGRALVATSRFPADHRVSFSDREYFIALRDGDAPFQIGGIVLGRVTRADVFTVAIRRGGDAEAFRRRHPGRRVAELFQQVRQRLVRRRHRLHRACCCARTARRSPAIPSRRRPRPASATGCWPTSSPSAPQGGLVRGISSIDGIERVIAYRRLANYPVYVTIGRRWSSVVGEWRDDHGDAPDLRHSGDAGPARAQPAGDAAVAAAARHAGAAAGRGAPARSGRGGAAPVAEDGSGGPSHRRHRARLQQPPDGDQQQHRTAAATAAAGQRPRSPG